MASQNSKLHSGLEILISQAAQKNQGAQYSFVSVYRYFFIRVSKVLEVYIGKVHEGNTILLCLQTIYDQEVYL